MLTVGFNLCPFYIFISPNKENVFNDQNLLLFVGDHFLNILETLMFDSGGGGGVLSGEI